MFFETIAKFDTFQFICGTPTVQQCKSNFAIVYCTVALVECHKITCPTPQNMGIDIKTDDLAHFWDLATEALAVAILILALGNCRSG